MDGSRELVAEGQYARAKSADDIAAFLTVKVCKDL